MIRTLNKLCVAATATATTTAGKQAAATAAAAERKLNHRRLLATQAATGRQQHHHQRNNSSSSSSTQTSSSTTATSAFIAAGLLFWNSSNNSATATLSASEDLQQSTAQDPKKTVPPPPPTMSAALQDVLASSDQHFDENQFQEALDVLNKHADQSLAEIKWRQARAMFKLSRNEGAPKAELIRSGYALVAAAVAEDEGNFACHKWMAILLDAKSELDGVKERVQQLETVKRHMERAVALNPEDPTGYHLLGNFAFGLADMPWYQRKIVSAIFATPPTGTYEEALGHFLTAEEKKANFYSMNLLLIGKCYAALKNAAKAKEWLQRAAAVKVLNEDDKRCKEEATGLLKKY